MSDDYPCPVCDGDGKLWAYEIDDMMYIYYQADCFRCEGSGSLLFD